MKLYELSRWIVFDRSRDIKRFLNYCSKNCFTQFRVSNSTIDGIKKKKKKEKRVNK